MAAEPPSDDALADIEFMHGVVEMNEALVLGAVHQHALTEEAEGVNAKLQGKIATREKTASELAEKARLLDLTSDAIMVRDVVGRISYWNRGAEVLYGWSRAEAVGQTTHALLQTETAVPMEEIAEELNRTGLWTGELVHRTRDGRRLTVLARKVLDRDSQGNPSAVLQSITDITERKQWEEALSAREASFHTLADAMPQLAWVARADGYIHWYNQRWYEYTGATPQGMEGWGWQSVHDPEVLPKVLEQWQGSIATGEPFEMTFPLRGANGEFRRFLTRVQPLKDAAGRVTQWFGTNTDVEVLQWAESALRESEDRFRSLFASAPMAIFACDRNAVIQHYNRHAVELWAREPECGVEQHCGSVKLWLPDGTLLPHAQSPIVEVLRTGIPAFDVEVSIERPDGSRLAVVVNFAPLKNAQGDITGAITSFVDITERKLVESALREAKEAAEAANQSKDRFLAVLSHELRTPLTPVLMAVEALENDPDLRPDVREDIVMIKRNIELETKLIDDLLDLNRIISGKLRLQLEAVDLNEAVRQVCRICRPQAVEQGVRMDCEFGADAGTVAADPARLQQVLWNLIKNAIKFTPRDGSIHVATARPAGGRGTVQVRDSGMGIAPEILPRIFDAFEQGDPGITRKFGGLGLGLAISKALMELHEGSIRAESTGAGQGATFTIELPAAQPAVGAAAPPLAGEGEASPRLRLLLVEDHQDTARKLRTLLERSGYVVSIASDVAGALDLAGRETFDLVISDLGLPDGSGYDVMAGLQKTQPLPGIAMSGYGMDEDVRRSREAGFSEHLVKPIDVPQLRAAIRRVMDKRG